MDNRPPARQSGVHADSVRAALGLNVDAAQADMRSARAIMLRGGLSGTALGKLGKAFNVTDDDLAAPDSDEAGTLPGAQNPADRVERRSRRLGQFLLGDREVDQNAIIRLLA